MDTEADGRPAEPEVLLLGRMLPATVEELRRVAAVLDVRDPTTRDALVARHAGTIRAIATSAHPGHGAPRALIGALPKLEVVACFNAGLDHIDVDAAAERGIPVTNTSQALAEDVADVAIAHVLLLLRRFRQADAFVRDGSWAKGAFPLARSAGGKRLGVLGLGTIGSAIARRAEAMGMGVSYTSRSARPGAAYRYVPHLRDLAAESDVLVVCCPATPETRNLVDAEILRALGPDGTLVNIARGSVVDEPALVRALQDGTVAGAGLDVFADEPHPSPELLRMDQVSLTPHLGSGTEETRTAMGRAMIASIVRTLRADA